MLLEVPVVLAVVIVEDFATKSEVLVLVLVTVLVILLVRVVEVLPETVAETH